MTDGVIITLATCIDTQNKSYLKIEFIDIFEIIIHGTILHVIMCFLLYISFYFSIFIHIGSKQTPA